MDADKNIKIAGKYRQYIQLTVTDPGFPRRGRQLPWGYANLLLCQIFAENCMKGALLGPAPD